MHVVVGQVGARSEVVRVVFQQGDGGTETGTEQKDPPNPILPVGKEIIWTFATFILLFLIMRYFLFPRLKRGMDARYARIRSQLEEAESVKAAAESEAARYQAALAEVRAEANAKIDAARQELDADRQRRLAEVNAGIAQQRAAAQAAAEAAREAAMAQVEQAVSEVAANVAERALGAPVDPAVAREAAAEVVRSGVTS